MNKTLDGLISRQMLSSKPAVCEVFEDELLSLDQWWNSPFDLKPFTSTKKSPPDTQEETLSTSFSPLVFNKTRCNGEGDNSNDEMDQISLDSFVTCDNSEWVSPTQNKKLELISPTHFVDNVKC